MQDERYITFSKIAFFSGLVDQLVDRLLCKQEVASSNLVQSTMITFFEYFFAILNSDTKYMITIPYQSLMQCNLYLFVKILLYGL